jgi:hypothetical protein
MRLGLLVVMSILRAYERSASRCAPAPCCLRGLRHNVSENYSRRHHNVEGNAFVLLGV